ncbi:MAG: hypothetical protein WAW23_10480 [Candidatus Methanoperedens sp.]
MAPKTVRIQDALFEPGTSGAQPEPDIKKHKIHRYIRPPSSDKEQVNLHKEIEDYDKSVRQWDKYAEHIPPVTYFSDWFVSRRGGQLRKNIDYINKNIHHLNITPRMVYNKMILLFLLFLCMGYFFSLIIENSMYKLIVVAIFLLLGQKISESSTTNKIKGWSEPDYAEKLVYNIALVNEAMMCHGPTQLLERVAGNSAFGPIAKEFSELIKEIHIQKLNPYDAIVAWSESQELESLRDIGKIMRLKESGFPIDVDGFINRAKRDSLRAIEQETKKASVNQSVMNIISISLPLMFAFGMPFYYILYLKPWVKILPMGTVLIPLALTIFECAAYHFIVGKLFGDKIFKSYGKLIGNVSFSTNWKETITKDMLDKNRIGMGLVGFFGVLPMSFFAGIEWFVAAVLAGLFFYITTPYFYSKLGRGLSDISSYEELAEEVKTIIKHFYDNNHLNAFIAFKSLPEKMGGLKDVINYYVKEVELGMSVESALTTLADWIDYKTNRNAILLTDRLRRTADALIESDRELRLKRILEEITAVREAQQDRETAFTEAKTEKSYISMYFMPLLLGFSVFFAVILVSVLQMFNVGMSSLLPGKTTLGFGAIVKDSIDSIRWIVFSQGALNLTIAWKNSEKKDLLRTIAIATVIYSITATIAFSFAARMLPTAF